MFARNSAYVPILSVLAFHVLVSPSTYSDQKETLAEYFRRAEMYGFSGSVLVARGDDVLLEKAYGYADHRRGLRANSETAYGTEQSLDSEVNESVADERLERGSMPSAESVPGIEQTVRLLADSQRIIH